MIKSVLTFIFHWMPIIFGVGFVAPVIAAMLVAAGFAEPFGLQAIHVGLALGLMWGSIAQFTGRWI